VSPLDLVIAGAILAAAGWLLCRSFSRGGGCAACPNRGCASRGRAQPEPLVRLGGSVPPGIARR
jgi:hypothetical protein